MPIQKVAVTHKFGIISHNQRLELLERCVKQAYETSNNTKKPNTTRNSFEVTEAFVTRYNNAQTLDEQERNEGLAHKMLQRIKRKAGLNESGLGKHVDLPVAWTELAQLAQCKGHIQEECLDVMINSLDQAPLHKSHVAALFFLAETTLYWLRTETIHQPYLRTGEIKLLMMGQLVFIRLFFHHMSGHLQYHNEFKNRLFTYLDGFGESQFAYNPYPNALLCIRYINDVGKMIIADCNIEAGEIKEGDLVIAKDVLKQEDIESVSHRSALDHHNLNERTTSRLSIIQRVYDAEEHENKDDTHSMHSGALSSSVHDLSPTLWHSLDVWRCIKQLNSGHLEALHCLENCAMGLATESRIDIISALYILGDVAKVNLQTLRTMQNLACGIRLKTPALLPVSEESSLHGHISHDLSTAASTEANKYALSDIYEKTEENLSSPAMSNLSSRDEKENHLDEVEPSSSESDRQATSVMQDSKNETLHQIERQKTSTTLKSNWTEVSIAGPHTGRMAEAGTELPTGRASDASSVPTFANKLQPDLLGIHGWPWEVAVTYCDILSDICIHGTTSSIKKLALVGQNKEITDVHRKYNEPEMPLISAGLIDLLYFKAAKEAHDKSANDWSWRVRYSAMQGLVKVYRSMAQEQTVDGYKTVAWNSLLTAHSIEKDLRVLEALKVGQVINSLEDIKGRAMQARAFSIGARIAAGLAALYLPPHPVSVPKSLHTQRKSRKSIPVSKPFVPKQLRTSLMEELQLATALQEPPVSYNTRCDFDLKRIVEDQWRKDLQNKMEEEEADRLNFLKKTQDQKEIAQKESVKLKQQKYKRSQTVSLKSIAKRE